MLGNKGYWQLKCIRDLDKGYFQFKSGNTYDVKDKFPGEDGTLESGYWEVKSGTGSLFNVSKEERETNTSLKCDTGRIKTSNGRD